MKELRLGLVCYGGVSLAVYMHGITSELHSLVRASEARTKRPDRGNPFPETTTEHVYFEILERIAATQFGGPSGAVPLRVIVDVIAGTSAGGINGVALAKALAHDLDQAPLKQVWLDQASIWKLLSPMKLLKGEAILNGDRMLGWVHQALSDMNKKEPADPSSLMPEDHKLDLFVTLTDCTGYRRTIDIHDPVAIFDREHRHVLSFSYQGGFEKIDDFGPAADPGLALAIRCTSSFPVAFAPVSIEDVSAVAKSWAENGREAFIATAFAPYVLENAQPTSAYFVDGGVLNNRPFDRAVQAILERPANHEVDRRLLFIEPHPAPPPDNPKAPKRPRLLGAARAALISIPSHQPIADALLDLARYNQRVLQIKHLIEVLKPKVDDLINTVIGGPTDNGILDLDKLLDWDKLEIRREQVRQHAETAAGAAFHSYAALKINSVLEHLTSAICRLQRYPAGSRQAILVARIVPEWAKRAKVITDKPDLTVQQVEFLQVFDLGYRRRRLRFLVEYVNQLYPSRPPIEARLPPRAEVDEFKTKLYALMKELQVMGSGEWLAGTPRQQLDKVFARGAIEEADRSPAALTAFLDANADIITSILTDLKAGLNVRLVDFDKQQAEGLNILRGWKWRRSIMGDLVARYLGFAYWDLLLYPIQALSEIAELDTIEVIRISPADTVAFNEDDSPQALKSKKQPVQHLKGVGLAHFGAFLWRSYRENDLLWGRLDGVERLFGILASVARESGVEVDRRLMWQGFQAVLDSEAPNLRSRESKRLLARLRAKVEGQLATDDDQPPGEPPLLRMDEAAD